MTTRNFRVNNGLSVGDVTISASANTITGLATSAPSGDGDVVTKAYSDSGTQTMTNKTLTSAVLNTGVSGTAIVDEDDMSSNSATKVPTQQSVKAYVDSEISGINSTTITQGNSNMTVTDSGTGTITASLDGTTALTITDGLVRVHGNLTVDGTETILNTSTLSVEDNIIELNRNVSTAGATPDVSGIRVNRGEGSTATNMALYWAWDETFSDDGTTTHGNAGGAWTAYRAPRGDDSGIGADSPLIDIRANVIHAASTSAQYADVAERFEADAPMAEGAVVEVGGTAEITETTTDLSDNVFGVISSQPAYAMNAGAGNNDSHPFVAMTGRTPVRVTGTVNKGDRLVTSSVKGCARAVAQGESISPFNVIGRALESNTDAGIKLVNCAVRTNN